MRFETVHGCAVPVRLADEVRDLANASGATLNSCDRSPQAEPILRANGKKSQRELRRCYESLLSTGRCPPGCGSCNPANRPGRSTHERRNDGIAYPGPAGMPLRYWQVGMDWSDSAGVIAAARRHDWMITITYPDNPRERHHLNLRKEPKLHIVPTLQRGSSGPWVVRLTRRLSTIRRPGPYLAQPQRRYSPAVEVAVRRYQADHLIPETGVVDAVTWNQLAVSFRREKQRQREEQQGPTGPAGGVAAGRQLQGPDVSKWQGDVDWDRVRRAGCDFAFARVADGDVRDERFGRGRCDAVRAAGLLLGVYYYGRVASPGNEERDGAAEARMALGFAREGGWGRPGDLRLAYDFEETNQQPKQKAARHLLQFVRTYTALTGHKPIVYTMPGFFRTLTPLLSGDDRDFLASCPLWVAHWRVAAPDVPEPWRNFAVWQHNDSGEVPGVAGKCDVNVTRVGFNIGKLVLRE